MDEARNAYMALGGVVLDPVNGNPYIEPGENDGNADEMLLRSRTQGRDN